MSGLNKASIIDHVARLAERQREWSLNANCGSSDSEESFIFERNKRRVLHNIISCQEKRISRRGIAIRRFPEEVSTRSPSPSETDTDDDYDQDDFKIIIDRSSMFRGRRGSRDPVRRDSSSFKLDRAVHKSPPSFHFKKLDGEIKVDGTQCHLINIGVNSFNVQRLLAVLGDSIKFILSDIYSITLTGEISVTGISETESLCFRSLFGQGENKNMIEFRPSCVGAIAVTCSVVPNIVCYITCRSKDPPKTKDGSSSYTDESEVRSNIEDFYPNNRHLDEFLGDNISRSYSEARTKPEKEDFSTVYFQNPRRLKPLVATSKSKKTPFTWQTKDALLGVGVSVVRKSASEKVICMNESEYHQLPRYCHSEERNRDSNRDSNRDRDRDRDSVFIERETPSRTGRASFTITSGKAQSSSQSQLQYPPFSPPIIPSDMLEYGRSISRTHNSTYAHSQSSTYDSDDLSIASDSNQSDSERGRKVKKIRSLSLSVQAHPMNVRSSSAVLGGNGRSKGKSLSEKDVTHTAVKRSSLSERVGSTTLYTSSNHIVPKPIRRFSAPKLHGSFSRNDMAASCGCRVTKDTVIYRDHGLIYGDNCLISGCRERSYSSSGSDSTPIVDFIPPSGDDTSFPTDACTNTLMKHYDDLDLPTLPTVRGTNPSFTPTVPCAPQIPDPHTKTCYDRQIKTPPSPYTASNTPTTPSSTVIPSPSPSLSLSSPSPKCDYLIRTNDVVVGVISKRIQEKLLAEMNSSDNDDYGSNDVRGPGTPKCNTLGVSSEVGLNGTKICTPIRDTGKSPPQPHKQQHTAPASTLHLSNKTHTHPSYPYPPSTQPAPCLLNQAPHGLRGSFGVTTSSSRPATAVTEEIRSRVRARGLMVSEGTIPGNTEIVKEREREKEKEKEREREKEREKERERESAVGAIAGINTGSSTSNSNGDRNGDRNGNSNSNSNSSSAILRDTVRVVGKSTQPLLLAGVIGLNERSKMIEGGVLGGVEDMDSEGEGEEVEGIEENSKTESSKQRRNKKKNLKKKLKKAKINDTILTADTEEFIDLELGCPIDSVSRTYSTYASPMVDMGSEEARVVQGVGCVGIEVGGAEIDVESVGSRSKNPILCSGSGSGSGEVKGEGRINVKSEEVKGHVEGVDKSKEGKKAKKGKKDEVLEEVKKEKKEEEEDKVKGRNEDEIKDEKDEKEDRIEVTEQHAVCCDESVQDEIPSSEEQDTMIEDILTQSKSNEHIVANYSLTPYQSDRDAPLPTTAVTVPSIDINKIDDTIPKKRKKIKIKKVKEMIPMVDAPVELEKSPSPSHALPSSPSHSTTLPSSLHCSLSSTLDSSSSDSRFRSSSSPADLVREDSAPLPPVPPLISTHPTTLLTSLPPTIPSTIPPTLSPTIFSTVTTTLVPKNIPNYSEGSSEYSQSQSRILSDKLRTQLGIGHLNGVASRLGPNPLRAAHTVVGGSVLVEVVAEVEVEVECSDADVEAREYEAQEEKQREIERYLTKRWDTITEKLSLGIPDLLPKGRVAPIIDMCCKKVHNNNIENKNSVRTDISDMYVHSVEGLGYEVYTDMDAPSTLEKDDDFILMSGRAKKERKKNNILSSKVESEKKLNINTNTNKTGNKNGQKNVKFSNRNNNLGKIEFKKKNNNSD